MKYAVRLRLHRLGCFGGNSKLLLLLIAFASYGGVMQASPAHHRVKQQKRQTRDKHHPTRRYAPKPQMTPREAEDKRNRIDDDYHQSNRK